MDDAYEHLDGGLELLARAIAAREHDAARVQRAELASRLDHHIRREERALADTYRAPDATAPSFVAKVRREHAILRRFVRWIEAALDRPGARLAGELTGTLRSVLLLHAAKERALLPARPC